MSQPIHQALRYVVFRRLSLCERVGGYLQRYPSQVTSCCRVLSSGSTNADWDKEANAELERQSKIRENLWRRFKKVFSTALFGSTFALVYYARRQKQAELTKNLEGCVRFVDEDYTKGHSEFYRVPSPETGKPAYVFPSGMVKSGTLRQLQNFKVRPTDVVVASFPKAGTTWVQEIAWLILHNMDFQKAAEKILESRSPYMEYLYPGIHSVTKMESPRLMKTHVPFDLLPPEVLSTGKIIYVRRNPKDVLVSYYHFVKMLTMSNYKGSFNDFLDTFIKDQVPYGPYFAHLESYLEKQDNPNILILCYEELQRDPAEMIRRIGQFLEHPLTEDEVQALVQHTTFESMSANTSVNYAHWDDIGIRNKGESRFFRKGKVGDWINYFTKETNAKVDAWIRNKNKGNIVFEYDLKQPESQEKQPELIYKLSIND